MERQLPPQIGDPVPNYRDDESEESETEQVSNYPSYRSDQRGYSGPPRNEGGLQRVSEPIQGQPGLQRANVPSSDAKRGWFSGPSDEEKTRRLRAQIKTYIKANPGLKLDKQSKLDESLQYKDLDELKDIMLNLKSQMGGPGPYESSKTLVDAAATFIEKKFKVNNFGKRCRENVDLITAVDSFVPIDLGDYSAPIQVVVHVAKTLWDCISDETNTNTTGISPAEATTNRTSETEATHFSPQSNHGSGPIPSGQNNVRSTNDQGPTISPSETFDCGVSDVVPGDVRPNKRVRT